MSWTELITPGLLFLIVFVEIVGLFLKKLPQFRAEWTIPFILWGVAVVAAVLVMAIKMGRGFAPATVLDGVIQGTFIAAIAVFGNNIVKQVTVGREKDRP